MSAAIEKYYDGISFYTEIENARFVRVPFNLSSNIFQSAALLSTVSMTSDPSNAIHLPYGNPQLLTTDKRILNEYLLYAGKQKEVNGLSIILLHISIEHNLFELMEDLQKEYNLH